MHKLHVYQRNIVQGPVCMCPRIHHIWRTISRQYDYVAYTNTAHNKILYCHEHASKSFFSFSCLFSRKLELTKYQD
jgi:hypothetical protein